MIPSEIPQVTFGMIVLNGEPFLRYNLRGLYPFAKRIVVVEGADPAAAFLASADGHSRDGTLEVLGDFKRREDPEGKVVVVTAEDHGYSDGFWPGEKDEQSRAYWSRAIGDWLWQVDVDEFYHPEDIRRILEYLTGHGDVTCLAFNAYHFWGGFEYLIDGGKYWSIHFAGEPHGAIRRVFRWNPDYRYRTHRPPTIVDVTGQNITRRCLLNATTRIGVRMYHYSMVLPSQMREKAEYYQRKGWSSAKGMAAETERLIEEVDIRSGIRIWKQMGYHNWLEPFRGQHPPGIRDLIRDIDAGDFPVKLRRVDDIESLLGSSEYRRRTRLLRVLERFRSLCSLIHYRGRLWSHCCKGILRRAGGPLIERLPMPMAVRGWLRESGLGHRPDKSLP